MKIKQDSKGEFIKVPLTPEELAALQPTPYELAMEDWATTFDYKFVVPDYMVEEHPSIVAWALLNKDKMLIDIRGDEAHVYYNVLKPNHALLVEQLNLEPIPKPKPEDYE